MGDFGMFEEQESEDSPVTLEDEKPGTSSAALYNLVSIVFLGLAGLACLFTVVLIVSPSAGFNPFPPDRAGAAEASLPTAFALPSSTPTIDRPTLPPTFTPTFTVTPVEGASDLTPVAGTGTPPADETGLETPTTIIETTPDANETPTPQSFPFILQVGSPETQLNPEDNGGCAYLGLAGTVFGIDGNALDGIAVDAKGENFSNLQITQFHTRFGLGSYEFLLNNEPLEAEFEVQLFSVSGEVLSEKVIIRTQSACEQNLTVLNFVQVAEF